MPEEQFASIVPFGDPAEIAAAQRRAQRFLDTEERHQWDMGLWEGLMGVDGVDEKSVSGLMAGAWTKHSRQAGLDVVDRNVDICAMWETAEALAALKGTSGHGGITEALASSIGVPLG